MKKRICIGISSHTAPERLDLTLTGLHRFTGQDTELLLLPDGPDTTLRTALAERSGLHALPQAATDQPLGMAACFNRLAAWSDAEVLVLLEDGAQVGPRWLDYLLAALEADPSNGLAGPSTNFCWNEQCLFPQWSNRPADVAQLAILAAQRHGAAIRTLEPLYSLAEFCYVVRREVVQAIGAADESYGLGPCWELDYNIRAARAGWRGVWATAAYVHRAPFTARHRRDEEMGFIASKHRYQDKFCALRLRGIGMDYEAHCRGDACEHFAPHELIQISLPLPTLKPATISTNNAAVEASIAAGAHAGAPQTILAARTVATPAAPPHPAASEIVMRQDDAPLVSCIMPTRNRPDFVLQSIRYFQRQDYPNRELIILDDAGGEDLAARLPADGRIRYVRLPAGLSIGVKRNRACELASGSIIAQWDDDDWYAPDRLSFQAAPLRSGQADITGLTTGYFFVLPRWEFWTCTQDLHRRLFLGDVHGGTLVYRKDVWERLARYPDASLAEDAAFLSQAMQRGARLRRLENCGQYLYVRHAENSWSFPCGEYLDPRGWQRATEPPLPPADRSFYAARSVVQQPQPGATDSVATTVLSDQLVSCIMPTANRRAFVPAAIRYFLRQDYPARELIVVDDGADCVCDLIPDDPRIRYVRLKDRHSIGAKRNLACEQARGEIILHWDDDDWIAPGRIGYQVRQLLDRRVTICGLNRLLYHEPTSGRSWQYVYPAGGIPWVGGNTLCYHKEFWASNPFPNINEGEDARFLWTHHPKTVAALDDANFIVGMIHGSNASPKRTQDVRWQVYSTETIQQLMGEDWTYYHADSP